MKMRSIAIVFLTAAFPLMSLAQARNSKPSASGFYLRFAAGYGFGESGNLQMDGIGINGSEAEDATAMNVTQKKVSFGQGVNLRLAGGYKINKNIAVELGLHGVIAPTYTYTSVGYYGFNAGYINSEINSTAVGPYYAIPAIVLSTGSKWKLYGRAGLALPLTQKIKQEVHNVYHPNSGSISTVDATQEVLLSFKPGLEGSIGLSHPISDRLSVQAEFAVISRTAYAKSAEVTSYAENGVDHLFELSEYSKKTNYATEQSYNNSTSPTTTPRKEITYPIGFSSMGLNLGITYRF